MPQAKAVAAAARGKRSLTYLELQALPLGGGHFGAERPFFCVAWRAVACAPKMASLLARATP